MLRLRLRLIPALILPVLYLPVQADSIAPQPMLPRISARRSAPLAEVVKALEQAKGGVLAADVSTVDARLQAPLNDVPMTDAWARISKELDRCWVVRGSALVLQRRYSDPEEDPGAEMEELRRATEELYWLVQPFSPRLRGIQYLYAKEAFLDSLTAEQQQAMIRPGLPVAGLPPAQRAAWLDINSHQVYGNTLEEIGRAALCLREWSAANAKEVPNQYGRRSQVAVFFPDVTHADRQDAVDVIFPQKGIGVRPRSSRAESAELPVTAVKPPAALRESWTLTAEELDLAGFAKRFAENGGPEITFPDYAKGRKFWLYSAGGTRAEVLSALADLWGWEVTPRRGGYRLDRPVVSAARDAADLREKMLRLIPPATRHMMDAIDEGATERWGRQMEYVAEDAVTVAGPQWEAFRPTQLQAENQRRLANTVVWLKLHAGLRGWLDRPAVAAWAAHPELGVLHLTGPITPGAHPLLEVRVPREDGKCDTWGWAVHTSSLYKNK